MHADSLLTPTSTPAVILGRIGDDPDVDPVDEPHFSDQPCDGCGSTRSIVHLGMSTARPLLGLESFGLRESNHAMYHLQRATPRVESRRDAR